MLRPQRVRKKTFKASTSVQNALSISQIVDPRVAKKRKLHALQPVPVEQVAAPEILRPVFGDAVEKWLEIPLAIDEYNHGMNGVDRANQLQRNYTVHRPQVYRTWQPQWHWLIDTCATNAFLMLNHGNEDEVVSHRGHRKFQESLAIELLITPDDGQQQVAETIQPAQPAGKKWRTLSRQSYCKWCLTHKDEASPRKRRKILGELPNQATRAFVPQTTAACDCHGTPLCRKSDCWSLYHSHIALNGSTLPQVVTMRTFGIPPAMIYNAKIQHPFAADGIEARVSTHMQSW